MKKKTYDRAWHFLRSDDKNRRILRDGRVAPANGRWLTHDGPAVICEQGLHASRKAIQALDYLSWDNAIACLVEVDEVVGEHEGDKLVCKRRRIVKSVACDELLREFARSCAMDVIHLWNAPQVVIDYLKTGDEKLRAAARGAAWAAARGAAWDAARDAAWDAARDAAWAAARGAAWAAAWGAAWAAAWGKQNDRLEALLLKAMGLESSK